MARAETKDLGGIVSKLFKAALVALHMAKPFVKMNAQQSEQWDGVTQLLDGLVSGKGGQ